MSRLCSASKLFSTVLFMAAAMAGALVRADEPAEHAHDATETKLDAAQPEGSTANEEHDSHEGEHKSKYADPPKSFEPALFICSLLVFLTLLFIGTRVAWKPLIAGLDSREARINQAYAAAKQARVAVEQCSREYEARLAATTDEVKAIVAAARQEAEKARADVVAAATTEALALQERAIDEIMRAKEQALTELNSAVEQQTNIATEHILGYHLAGR
jgi:F-type H+-transporting ATPase subunit b